MVFFCFSSIHAWAQTNLGYIRVVVREHNAAHRVNVELFANGNKIGPGFSHASSGFGWQALTVNNLSRNSRSTPIYAAYPAALAQMGCEFSYDIEFSLDGQSVISTFRNIRAPYNNNAGSIPLGLGCGRDGTRLCSSDPQLQQKIIQAANKVAKANYDRWKNEYNQRIQARENEAAARASLLSQELTQRNSPDFENLQKKFLEDRIGEWKAEADRQAREQIKRDSGEDTAPKEFSPENAAKIGAEAAAVQKRQEAIAQLDKISAGHVILDMIELDKSIADMIHREQNFIQVARTMPGSEDEIRASEGTIEGMKIIRREALRGKTFLWTMKQVAKTGVDVSPTWFSTAVKVCEIARGRELCIGHKLTAEERISSICSMGLDQIPYIKRAKEELESSQPNEWRRLAAKGGEARIGDRACDFLFSQEEQKK
jgi:hypothetical protein